jgi:preprotein translocase subunit SecD
MMLLDDKVIYAAPISPYLAQDISAHRIEGMTALTGTGDNGREMARNLSLYLRGGALPVKMEVVSPVKNVSYNATVPLL